MKDKTKQSARINFTAWGRGNFEIPAFAMRRRADSPFAGVDSPSDCVAEAIARKSGLCLVHVRSDGYDEEYGEIVRRHFVCTLGSRADGGWCPEAEVWFWIPEEEFRNCA